MLSSTESCTIKRADIITCDPNNRVRALNYATDAELEIKYYTLILVKQY